MYRTQELINQFFKSSWVPNLAKRMSVMCENNIWEIWLHKCKIDIVNNAMHVLIYMCNACESNHKWCMTRLIGQESKNWNFPVSIGQKSIRLQSN